MDWPAGKISVPEASYRLHVHYHTVLTLLERGELRGGLLRRPGPKKTRIRYVNEADVERLLAARRSQPA